MNWVDKAKQAILDSSETSSIYIGCDSVRSSKKKTARYSTVIVLHVNSNNGCKIFHNSVTVPDYGNIKQRMLTEVQFAIEAATEIIDIIGNRHLEIHIDVNPDPKHKSNAAVKEAIGYVRGSLGLDPKVKPDAFAASYCADHMVNNQEYAN